MVLTDDEKVQRGFRAEHLLSSGIFDEALTDIKSVLHASLETFVTDEAEPVMAVMRQLRALRHVRGRLEGWVSEARTIRIQSGEQIDD